MNLKHEDWTDGRARPRCREDESPCTDKFPNLFSPLKVGTHTYKNRIVGSPIFCGPFVSIPFLSDVTAKAMYERAKGGCAAVTVGETSVDFEYANKDPFPPIDFTNYEDPAFAKLGALAKSIKDNGAIAMIELSHCGSARMPLPMFKGAIGPNEETNEFGMKITGMDKAMIDDVIQKHVVAAKFMRAAGYDGVLIHCGHGWLLAQFLSARTNHRTDEYGGSLENRARFSIEILKALREAMGKDFLIEVRVSGDERSEGGQHVDEIAAFAKMIEPYIDLIHVSVGIYRQPVLSGMFNSLFEPHALNADMAAVIKKAVKIPVTVVGGINSPELSEQIIAEGKCDFVAMGRQLTADPDFAVKAENGNEDDIVRCTRCFKCLPGQLEEVMDDLSKLFGCSVNPTAFLFDRKMLDSKPAGIAQCRDHRRRHRGHGGRRGGCRPGPQGDSLRKGQQTRRAAVVCRCGRPQGRSEGVQRPDDSPRWQARQHQGGNEQGSHAG